MSSDGPRMVYVVSKWNHETETFVRREVAAALDAGTEIQVVSLQAPGPSDGIVDDSAIRIVVPTVGAFLRVFVPTLRRGPRRTLEGLRRILRYGRPGTWLPHLRAWAAAIAVAHRLDDADVILAHFAWLSSTTADNIGRFRSVPYAVFVHAHGIYETRCQDRYLTDRLCRASVVFVESEFIASDVRERHGVDPIVMRMGVPEEFVVPEPRDRSHDDPPVVLSIGALREKKGHDLLIRAVAELNGVHLRIAGEGRQRRRLESLVDTLGVNDRVHLLGHQDLEQVRVLLDQATVFCLASRLTDSGDRDGVPNVLIEAMARGVPVVATKVSGIPDLLRDGCGLTVPPDDEGAVRAGIAELLRNRSHAARLARTALDRVRVDYTTNTNAARLTDMLLASTRTKNGLD